LALVIRHWQNHNQLSSNVIGFIGLAVVIGGAYLTSKPSNWPGLWTPLPVLGTLMMINLGTYEGVSQFCFLAGLQPGRGIARIRSIFSIGGSSSLLFPYSGDPLGQFGCSVSFKGPTIIS